MANKNWQQISYNQSANLTNPSEKNIEKDISEIFDNYKWIFTIITHDNDPKLILNLVDLEKGVNKLKSIITDYIKENFEKS